MIKVFTRKMSIIILFEFQLILILIYGDTREVLHVFRDEFPKNKGCCMPTYPEDFKNCVIQKRRSLPTASLGFKSISCQCHKSPITTELRTRTKWVQSFRQCLLTDTEYKEPTLEEKKLDLFKACKEGNLVAVKSIISHQPEKLYIRDKYRHTPLMNSAWYGQAGVFNYLACHTCKWNTLNKHNDTMLHIASIGGSVDIVKRVLSLRLFNIDSKSVDERTPVLLAVRFGNTDVAKLLIQAGCNLMLTDRDQNNMLHLGSKSKKRETLEFVMALGLFGLESREFYGQTPLLIAARKGFLEGCKYLIQQGANVSAIDNDNNTLLHQVLMIKTEDEGRLHMMRYFLSKDYVNKESKGEFKQTPLLSAASKGDLGLFKLLVSEGCNVHATDEVGNSILHLAAHNGKFRMVSHILDERYVSPSTRGKCGITALMESAYHGYLNIFRLLQRAGSNITNVDDIKRNVLHWACIYGHVNMISHILSQDTVPIDVQDTLGYTPLMYTVRNGRVPAFKMLQRKGCLTKLRNDKGSTILHLACISRNTEMVKLLIKLKIAQPYLDKQNADGKTPKQLAEEADLKKIVKLLKMLEEEEKGG